MYQNELQPSLSHTDTINSIIIIKTQELMQ